MLTLFSRKKAPKAQNLIEKQHQDTEKNNDIVDLVSIHTTQSAQYYYYHDEKSIHPSQRDVNFETRLAALKQAQADLLELTDLISEHLQEKREENGFFKTRRDYADILDDYWEIEEPLAKVWEEWGRELRVQAREFGRDFPGYDYGGCCLGLRMERFRGRANECLAGGYGLGMGMFAAWAERRLGREEREGEESERRRVRREGKIVEY